MSYTFATCKKCHAVNRIQTNRAQKAVCGKCQNQIPFHGLVSDVNEEDFHKILKSSDLPVVVDFWAGWCGPCKMYGPEFQKASLEIPQFVFLKVDTEAEKELSARLGVRGIPCTIIFRNGKEIKRQAGAMDVNGVRALLSSL